MKPKSFLFLPLVAFLALEAASRADSDYEKQMYNRTGVTNIRQWEAVGNFVAQGWHLSQVMNGIAVYRSRNRDFAIGVKADGITIPLRKGDTLYHAVECAEYVGDVQTKDEDGFALTMKCYVVQPCGGGK